MYIFRNDTAKDIILSYRTDGTTTYLSDENEVDPYDLVLPAGCEIPRAVYCDYLTPTEESIRPVGTY